LSHWGFFDVYLLIDWGFFDVYLLSDWSFDAAADPESGFDFLYGSEISPCHAPSFYHPLPPHSHSL